jgi:hypothetical protein
MERMRNYFKLRQPTFKSKRISSVISLRESEIENSTSIFGITTPKSIINHDIKNGKRLSLTILEYIKTNFTEDEKYELILTYNTVLASLNNIMIYED